MERERPLDADAERLLASLERFPGTGALALDHDPLEHLNTAALALDHLEVDAHGVARLEPGAIAAQLALFEVLDDPMLKNGPVGPRRMLADDNPAGGTGSNGRTGKSPYGLQTASQAMP